MTKEELKQQIINDPAARAKFIASANKFYEDLGIGTDHEELHALQNPEAASASAISRPIPVVLIIPIVVVFAEKR